MRIENMEVGSPCHGARQAGGVVAANTLVSFSLVQFLNFCTIVYTRGERSAKKKAEVVNQRVYTTKQQLWRKLRRFLHINIRTTRVEVFA